VAKADKAIADTVAKADTATAAAADTQTAADKVAEATSKMALWIITALASLIKQ
jgi:hypothetical protein